MDSVSYTQNWRLRRMDRWVTRSDPHLAAMLAIFARLNDGEAIASIEQGRSRPAGPRGTLVWMGATLWLLLTYVGRAIRWTAKAAARPWSGGQRSWLGLGSGHVRSHVNERYS